jgi:hypothetical protein
MQAPQPARVACPLQRFHLLLAKQKCRVPVSTFGLRLPAHPGGDAGSSARQGCLSAAAQSPAPGTKQKIEGSNLNIWIKAASASRWERRQLSPPGSPVSCRAITNSWHKTKMEGSSLNIWIKAASASRWGRRQLSQPGSPVRCSAITSSWHKTKNGGFESQRLD